MDAECFRLSTKTALTTPRPLGLYQSQYWIPRLHPPGARLRFPYRRKPLVVPKGEALTLNAPNETLLGEIFKDACTSLPSRLFGTISPGIRDQYTLSISHHTLGSAEFHWRSRRPRTITGRGRRQLVLFNRECAVHSQISDLPSKTMHEQACTFRVPFPPGQRPEIPNFFLRDPRSFLAEVAWVINKRGTPNRTRGVRRYPLAYDTTSESALTGLGVHFSGPYTSDAERHGPSQLDNLNKHIDEFCKEALVDIMASHLIHRHGGRVLELYLNAHANSHSDSLHDLVDRTLDRRAIPLRRKPRPSKRTSRTPLGPRQSSSGGSRRVILPMFTWGDDRVSSLLSEICPAGEDQIDKAVPGPILRFLSRKKNDDRLITFSEDSAIERLQPALESVDFPWKDEFEWQTVLANTGVAKSHLDVVFEAIQQGKLDSESEVALRVCLPDQGFTVRPLAEMYRSTDLPATMAGSASPPILHPEIQCHRLLKRRVWRPKPYTLDDYLDEPQLEAASLSVRMSFWTWLCKNWRVLKPRTRRRIFRLPVWPSSDGHLLPLEVLCEPHIPSVATVLGDAIRRPSPDLLKAFIVRKTRKGRPTLREDPNLAEMRTFLSRRLEQFPTDEALTQRQQSEFHRFEDALIVLSARPRVKRIITQLSGEFAIALAADGNLYCPTVLVRSDGATSSLHLLARHSIDRPNRKLDRIEGWRPSLSPSTTQIVETLTEDGTRIGAHVPRLREYVKQAKRESIACNDLLDIPCIPINVQLLPPGGVSLRGRRDFWGDWRTAISVTDISPDVQRLYKQIGVFGGEPDSASSRHFFQWLASQDGPIINNHTDQILRHISHKSGPRAWTGEFPGIPCILVESDDGRVRLVTRAEATRSRAKVVIPDFEALEEAIRRDSGRRPVDIAVVDSRRVTEPILSHLRNFGLRTLSDYAGEPVQVFGQGESRPASGFDCRSILDSLLSGLIGRQLRKRLATLGLDSAENTLRSNWRQHLSSIQSARTAESVIAKYQVGRRTYSIPVDGEFDRSSGTLWLRSDCDDTASFFDVIADRIFEQPQKYYGPVLDRAYRMDLKERHPTDFPGEIESSEEDTEFGGPALESEERGSLRETTAVHSGGKPDLSRNLPNPGPIPTGPGAIRDVSRPRRERSRDQGGVEDAQIEDLKENQYAWHCQACIAKTEPSTLAPSLSYVVLPENRRSIMHAHHCDHRNAGGARNVGNILLLCRYHHSSLGDSIGRGEILRSLQHGAGHRVTFHANNGESKSIYGKVVILTPPQAQDPIPLFFTIEHRDYWVSKAREEGLM